MPNLAAIMSKLQMALSTKGVYVEIEKKTFFSLPYQKWITIHKIVERDPVTKEKTVLVKAYRQEEAVKALAARWQEVKGNGA